MVAFGMCRVPTTLLIIHVGNLSNNRVQIFRDKISKSLPLCHSFDTMAPNSGQEIGQTVDEYRELIRGAFETLRRSWSYENIRDVVVRYTTKWRGQKIVGPHYVKNLRAGDKMWRTISSFEDIHVCVHDHECVDTAEIQANTCIRFFYKKKHEQNIPTDK